MVIVAGTFILCAGIVLGMYWLFIVRSEDRAASALRRRLHATPDERPARSALTKKATPLSALKVLDMLLPRSGRLVDPLKRSLATSGLPFSVGAVLLASFFLATFVVATMNALGSSAAVSFAAAMVVATLPFLFVRRAARRRLGKLEEQLPQAVDMIAVSLRAGHAFTTGLLMVAEELPSPLGAEFRLVHDQQNYGKPLPDVLREFADRVPLLDARIFVTAVLTQRETGGNLAEVLDKLAGVIRERFRVRRQVRAVSAHGRVTGWVLGLLPPGLALLLYIISPAHITTLTDDPLGRQLVVGAIILQLVGMLTIRKIVNVEF